MEVHHHPKARQAGKGKNKIEPYAKKISFIHISLDGFVAGPNGEMNWTKINYEFRMMNYESDTLRKIHNS